MEVNPLRINREVKEVDKLPILHALLMETLRLHPAIGRK